MALLFSFPWMPRNSSYPVAQKRGGKNTRQSFSHRTDQAPLFFVGQSVADVRGQGKRWLSYLLAPGQNHSRPPFIMLRNPHSNHPLSGGHRPSQPSLLHRPVLSPSQHAPASSHSLCPSTSPKHFSAGEEAGRIQHPPGKQRLVNPPLQGLPSQHQKAPQSLSARPSRPFPRLSVGPERAPARPSTGAASGAARGASCSGSPCRSRRTCAACFRCGCGGGGSSASSG